MSDESKDKTTRHSVYLSDRAVDEVEQLVDLYCERYESNKRFSLSKLCNMGLMMLGSLSYKELYNVEQWYDLMNYY